MLFAAGCAGHVLTGAVLLMAVLSWSVASGLVSLGVARPYLETAMENAPVHLEIDDAQFAWSGMRQPFGVAAQGIRLRTADGELITTIPELLVGLDTGALFEGRIVPRSLSIIRPEIRVVRSAPGSFNLGLGEGDDLLGLLISAVAAEGAAAGGPVGMSALDELSVVDGRLRLEDQHLGHDWEASGVNFTIQIDEGLGVRGALSMTVELGARRAPIRAEFTHLAGGGETTALMSFRNVVPAELVSMDPAIAFLAAVTSPVDGRVELTLGDDFRPERAVFAAEAGAGQLHLAPMIARPFDVTGLEVTGEIDFDGHRLVVDHYSVDLGGPRLTGRLEGIAAGGEVQTWADAELTNMPIDLLATYWPEEVAGSPRQWVTSNLSEGFIESATVRLHLIGGEGGLADARIEAVEGEIQASDTAIRYLEGMPPVLGVEATIRYDETTMRITGVGGQILDLGVPEATVDMVYAGEGRHTVDIGLVVVGPVSSAIRLIDRPPLRLASMAGLDPDRVSGEASTRLRFSFPLLGRLAARDIAIAGASNLQNVQLARIVDGHDLERVGGHLRFDGAGLRFEGTGVLAEVPLAVVWEHRFHTDPAWRQRVTMRGRMTEEQRRVLGLDLIDGLGGPVGFDAVLTGLGDGRQTLEASLDLADATLSVPALGWTKPPGTAGQATIEVSLRDGLPVAVPAFTLVAGDLDVSGAARLAAGSTQVEAAELFRLRFGYTDLRARFERMAGGGFSLAVSGAFLDGRDIVDQMLQALGSRTAPEPRGPEDRRRFTFDIARVGLVDGREARRVLGSVVLGTGLEESVDLRAVVGNGTAVQLRSENDAGVARLDIASDDFGDLLEVLGAGTLVDGGRLAISAGRSGPFGAPWTGTLLVEDYVIRDAPVLARLLAAVSLVGLGDALNREGIAFARLAADLALADETLRISNMRTAGGTLGLNFDGAINLGTSTVTGGGTIVPIDGLNRVVGGIPVLGDILAGVQGQGIFAFAYAVGGPLSSPSVQVNPLSLITPGILRDIFFDPGGLSGRSSDVSAVPTLDYEREWMGPGN